MFRIEDFLTQFQRESRVVGIPMAMIGDHPTRIDNNNERRLEEFILKAKREGARIVLALLGDERFYGQGMVCIVWYLSYVSIVWCLQHRNATTSLYNIPM